VLQAPRKGRKIAAQVRLGSGVLGKSRKVASP
jgi:hypothetical protein